MHPWARGRHRRDGHGAGRGRDGRRAAELQPRLPHRPRPTLPPGPGGRHRTGKPVAILADLQGPKIRLGRFADGPTCGPPVTRAHHRAGLPRKTTTASAPPTATSPPTPAPGTVSSWTTAKSRSPSAGRGPRRRVHRHRGRAGQQQQGPVPARHEISVPALSDKDIDDLECALRPAWTDRVVVRAPATDIEPVHEVMDRVGRRVPVIAKIESPKPSTTST